MKLIDRYIVRETLGPFLMALGMFTFVFGVQPALHQAQNLLSKGVDLGTVGFLLLTLVPQALGLSLPMAFLTGLLMGLGRLSGDREAVALLACGVSPLRILRPVLLLALLAGAADMYVLMNLIPDANQAFRVRTTQLLATKSESEIRPGTFYEGFPGKVLLIQEQRPEGGWKNVVLADTSDPGREIITLATAGYLEVDQEKRQVAVVLPGDSVRYTPGAEPGVYDMSRATDLRFAIPTESVFGDGSIIQRGNREMRIPELRAEEARKRAYGISPHPEIIQRHQMFAFPVACLVFGLVGLALGVHSRKEGKLGGFTVGLAVLFAYYGIMVFFEGKTKGGSFPAEWARWMPNIALGIVGLLALRWRVRAVGGEMAVRVPALVGRWFRRRGGGDASAKSAPRIVVVIRIPDVRLPRPRLLDLYVGRRYLSIVGLSFAGLLGLYYIGTVIDKSERLFKGTADGWTLAQFLYYSTPQFLAYVVPMAILFAVLATVGALTRNGELVVMRSCGVSLYRAALPLLVLALVWSGGLFWLDDRVLARANHRAEELDRRIRGGSTTPTIETSTTNNWLVDTRGRIYHFTLFEPARGTMHGVSVLEPSPRAFELASHTWAAKATFTGGAWRAERGWVQKFSSNRATQDAFKTRTLDLDPPQAFPALQNQGTEMMTLTELRKHVQERATQGQAVVEPRVELQERVAFPMVTIVMTILGIPFGATTGRRGSLYGISLALILGVSYWLVNTLFLAIGEAALMPAALAAWAANLLFLALAAYMTLTVRT